MIIKKIFTSIVIPLIFLGNFFFSFHLFSQKIHENFEKYVYNGERLYRDGAFEEAFFYYKKAYILLSNNEIKDKIKSKTQSHILYQMTLLSLFLGNEEAFLSLLQNKTNSNPEIISHTISYNYNKDQGDFVKAWSEYRHGRLASSKKYFIKLESTSPFFKLRPLFLAKIDYRLGNPKSALTHLKEVDSNSDPILTESQLIKAEILMSINQFKEAANTYEDLISCQHAQHLSAKHLANYIYCRFQLIDSEPDSLKKCRNTLLPLFRSSPLSENKLHALAYYHISMGHSFGSPEHFLLAQELLSNHTLQKGSPKTQLLKSQVIDDLDDAISLCESVLRECSNGAPEAMDGYRHLGRLQYFKAHHLKKSGDRKKALETAKHTFQKMNTLSQNLEHNDFYDGLEWYVHCCLALGMEANLSEAMKELHSLPSNFPVDRKSYLVLLLKIGQGKANFDEQIMILTEKYPESPYTSRSLFSAAAFYFRQGEWEKSHFLFKQFSSEFPRSPYTPDALYYQIAAGKKCDIDVRPAIQKLYTLYPDSNFSGEVYLELYNWEDYVNGSPKAISHLERMTDLFPLSPYLIEAYYLSGLDLNRDQKTGSGKLVRKKNPYQALIAFEEGELLFRNLYQQERIPKEEEMYHLSLSLRCQMERALTLMKIAEQSTETKKKIHFEYASDVLNHLMAAIKEFHAKNQFPELWEEALYMRAKVSMKLGQMEKAKELFAENLDELKKHSVTRGYFLSRTFYRLGLIAMEEKRYKDALIEYENAVDAAKGDVLSTHQQLDLWIQQSLCYQALNEDKTAMKILSKVINEDAASSMRLKAMYLRSEIYLQQGRKELAIKQLEALSLKGGRWAEEARKKLMEL